MRTEILFICIYPSIGWFLDITAVIVFVEFSGIVKDVEENEIFP